jgi:hypothetical protein
MPHQGLLVGFVSTDGMFGGYQSLDIQQMPSQVLKAGPSYFHEKSRKPLYWVDRKEHFWSIPSKCVLATAPQVGALGMFPMRAQPE